MNKHYACAVQCESHYLYVAVDHVKVGSPNRGRLQV